MKKIWLLAPSAAVLLAASLSCKSSSTAPDAAKAAAAAPPAASAPKPATRMLIAERTKDFGDVNRGDTAAHTFAIKNISSEVLHIKRAQGS